MSELRQHIITQQKTKRLRVGIKWDPLEKDDIADAYAIESPEEARWELKAVTQHIISSKRLASFLRMTGFFTKKILEIEKTLDQSETKKKAMMRYLAQEKLPSYDLDLCCFCYNKDGKLVKFVNPVSMEKREDLQVHPPFMHTGDATTGVSGTFDEEILVNLSTVDPATTDIFFVIISISHGFNLIKGGFWSIISTKDEDELMSINMKTEEPHRVHVMARLTRGETSWSLTEIGDYCPIEKIKVPLQQRIDMMLHARYMAKTEPAIAPVASPESGAGA